MRAFRIAYDGRPFHGFQRQPDVPTIEDTLFDALESLDVLAPETDKPAGYAAAGRTDAGVSAVAQTIAFEAPEWLTPRAFNSELPGSIRAWASAPVADDFHATIDAVERTYRYFLYAPRGDGRGKPRGTAHTEIADQERGSSGQFEDEHADEVLTRLAGRHDFHNFTPDAAGTVRTVELSGIRTGRFYVIDVTADGFPRSFVRRLVAVVRGIATGSSSMDWLDRILDSEPVTGENGIASAPPEPLILRNVTYPGIEFTVDEEAVERTRDAFAARRRRGATLDRLAGDVLERVRRSDL